MDSARSAPPPGGRGPTSTRRELAATLAASRSMARLSSRSLAEATGMSLARVSRTEHATALPSREEARRWSDATGADERVRAEIDALVERAHRETVPWAEALAVPESHLQDRVADDERSARLIRSVSLTAVPGLLQTAAYARQWIPAVDVTRQVDHEAALRARLGRQRLLGDGAHRVEFLVAQHVVDNADRIAPGQRAHLEDAAALPGVRIAVLSPVALICRTGFTIFAEKVDGAAAHVDVELLHGDLRVSHPRDVSLYEEQFSRMQCGATPMTSLRDGAAPAPSSART